MRKYHAIRQQIDGIQFDSHAEAMRYCQLKLMQDAGAITYLSPHPRFCLLDAFKRGKQTIKAIYYEADFAYRENGAIVVEDVKGMRTQVYLLKRKLFMARYPEIDFREVEA